MADNNVSHKGASGGTGSTGGDGRSHVDGKEMWTGYGDGSPDSLEGAVVAGDGTSRSGRLFLYLLAGSGLFVLLVSFLLWYIPTVGLSNIHPFLPLIFGGLFVLLGLFVLTGVLAIGLAMTTGRHFFFSDIYRGLLVKLFLPIMLMVGGALGIKKIRIENAFVAVNNQLVRLLGRKVRPEKLMLLMPHCIQYEDCNMKVTRDVKECVSCGKCEVADLLVVSDEFNLDLFIATGGTVARRLLKEKRPEAVIAVACERDLTSGIMDAYPLPVLAVVNKRPEGYCRNTGVDMVQIKDAVKDLLDGGTGGGPGAVSREGAA